MVIGHTACLWDSDKLLIYGGENEHRVYLSDVIVFDLITAHWRQPEVHGPIPRGRARHSAVIHDNKLFISGGLSGHDNDVQDDLCYLDLKTWRWSRTWKFVPRYDHTIWAWGGRLWVYGGMCEDMERTSEIWWLDLKGNPAFDSQSACNMSDRPSSSRQSHSGHDRCYQPAMGATGYPPNSSSIQTHPSLHAGRQTPFAPGSISFLSFVSSPNLPVQALGAHFHVFSSGCLLDFVTPASVISSSETCLSALDLDNLRWQKLANGRDLFNPAYRWHYCAMNEDGTQAWLLGCPTETQANGTDAEFLSDVLPIDLRKLGLLGNSLSAEPQSHNVKMPASDAHLTSHLAGIGADLATMFDRAPETGSGTDFAVTGEAEEGHGCESRVDTSILQEPQANASPPIHVHKLILQARWPHFSRLYASQMAEFHTRKLHIPEPYSNVRAFLYYLYTDSIAPVAGFGPDVNEIGGMLVMSNIYQMPRLRLLCVNRLGKELDIEHVAVIWEKAGVAGEDWLRRRAAAFAMTHWGRVVRTSGFKNLKKQSLLELCEEIDNEGRVVGGEELELVGGLGGAKLGGSALGLAFGRKRRAESVVNLVSDGEEGDGEEDEGMELT